MTHEHTLQVSDRRLINVRTGRLISNKTNKAVLVCGHFGFGYTGVAKLENEDVDEWLTRVLSDSALKGPEDSMEALRVRATEAVRQLQSRLSPQERRVAFVGAGWNRPPHQAQLQPTIVIVSNFFGEADEWLAEARDEFSIATFFLKGNRPFGVIPAGQDLLPDELTSLNSSIRKVLKRDAGPWALGRLLLDAARRVARRESAVGRDFLLTSIPRAAIFTKGFLALLDRPTWDGISFLYVPESEPEDGIAYGPNIACPGAGVIVFRAGRL